jgi:hypothetical protein
MPRKRKYSEIIVFCEQHLLPEGGKERSFGLSLYDSLFPVTDGPS